MKNVSAFMWLDDVRPAPEGWTWVKTVDEAKAHLLTNEVEWVSLDHDLGAESTGHYSDLILRGDCKDGSGLDVVKWMCREKKFPTEGAIIHSWNPEGARRMAMLLQHHGKFRVIVRPFGQK